MKAFLTTFLAALVQAILNIRSEELKKELIPLLLDAQRIMDAGNRVRRLQGLMAQIDHALPESFSAHQIVQEVFQHFQSSSKLLGGKQSLFGIRRGWSQDKMRDFVAQLIRTIRVKDQERQPKRDPVLMADQVNNLMMEVALDIRRKRLQKQEEQAIADRLAALKLP